MIKDIIANLPLHAQRDVVAPFAADLAGRFGAQLTGIVFKYQPVMPPDVLGLTDAHFIEEQEAQAKKLAEGAIERLNFEIKREQVPWASRLIEASADEAPRKFAEIARTFDLVVLGQADPENPSVDDIIAEAALFESGRPVLLVPYIQTACFQRDRVAIFWDGSRPAARAAADALSLVEASSKIHLVSVHGDRELPEDINGVDMASHLARHGHDVQFDRLTISAGTDITSIILNFVADKDIQLLVMGGYGHSRLREFVLGGATRGILRSMTVPTLMSH
jgi:nucleotide-binding universal stress UspA family protein